MILKTISEENYLNQVTIAKTTESSSAIMKRFLVNIRAYRKIVTLFIGIFPENIPVGYHIYFQIKTYSCKLYSL